MSAGRPVARLLAPVITRVMVVVVVLAGIAIIGVVVSTRAVQHVTDDLQPAAAAHQDALQDISDMQSAVRAYAQAGQDASLDDYRQAFARLPGHQQQVRRYAAGDATLDELLTAEEDAAAAWLRDYAAVRIQRDGGPGTFNEELFRTGLRRFDAFRQAHTDTASALNAELRDAREQAELRLRGTILAVLLVAALGAWSIARARTRLLRELADPLKELEVVVHKMTHKDRTIRASDSGPREVRAVAVALNTFADAQARANAVESRIAQELRTLDTAREDFVANVSHELRTPLTTISGYLELVAEEFEGKMAPRHEKMVDASRRNVARLRLLIDDLLTLSRAESRATDMERIDLGMVVRDVVTDVRMTAARRGITIEVDIPKGEQLVLGDRATLHRALLNVLSNAVKFSHDGGTVEITVRLDGDHWRVATRDHGIGIPEAEMERLGTRFFRATNAVTNEIAGTGLGVRIVQTIIDKHAGRLLIDSVEGAGTTVTIHLPAQAGALPQQAPEDSAPEDSAPEEPVEPAEAVAVPAAEPSVEPAAEPSVDGAAVPSDDEFLAAVEPRRRRD